MSVQSHDGDEGYPGTLSVQVSYQLTEDNALNIQRLLMISLPLSTLPTMHTLTLLDTYVVVVCSRSTTSSSFSVY